MPFASETGKLPKGQAYPLKPSQLQAALEAAGIDIDTHLVRGPGRRLFDAHFWPPNPNIPYERLYITMGSVPAGDAHEVRIRAEHMMLPKLIAWVGAILAADKCSPVRREKHFIDLSDATPPPA